MPPIVIAAVVAGAATVAGSAISSHASSSAAKKVTDAATSNNALQREIYDKNASALAPYVAGGNAADTRLQALLGLGGDRGAADDAFHKYLESTGYQFQYGEGMRALTGSRATAGLLDSGETVKAAERFGQGTASSYFERYINSLAGERDSGRSAVSAQAGVGQAFANATGANNTAAAETSANAGLVNARSITDLINGGVGLVGQVIGQSSYGKKTPSGSGGVSPNITPFVQD